MVTFDDFLDSDMDLTIQNALREVDMTLLATAMVGLTEEIQAIFLRNMSHRAADLLREEMSTKREIARHRIEAAQTHIKQLLRKHVKYAARAEPSPGVSELPQVELGDEETMVDSFRALAAYVGKHGFLPLEALEGRLTHPLMKKGIEFLVDGWDPLLMRDLLIKKRDALVAQTERRLDMILDGLDGLSCRELPQVIEERLRAHLPGS